ncbi:hypothetical protein HHK36_004098 [Tetracentron sinense]|uniref:IST1-like protein n=1 Tax=Tetracentron sinense TaxID=13715 RepID=A0A835DSV7_TETSI|nr:hypothetical protein HHK36_004098 [Tetracentron sinense]
MSMLDAFFSKGFKGAKCKTLLKLTIPRIKLLRNRREIQIKQMRRDMAKLLETGQEATARIRVEHIIREENMIAAQEIIELFCELIAVRLPIIETQRLFIEFGFQYTFACIFLETATCLILQNSIYKPATIFRECPLDLKEAISSVCFAAPRCADLPELQQVQMLFASKYGKEFVSAATELMPECGVNRQIIELLSVRAPLAETKLKLLKEIAEEHEIDWDPAASETEFLKPREDLLNGPAQFVSASKLPLPNEKQDESLHSAHAQVPHEQSDSDTDSDQLELPEVPKVSLGPSATAGSASEMIPPLFPVPPDPGLDHELTKHSGANENLSHEPFFEPEEVLPDTSMTTPYESANISATQYESANISAGAREDKQFLPFISPPSLSSASFSASQSMPPPILSRTKSEANVDLQDVLAAAHAAAESAERAAAAARSAASLAQVRITELVKKRNDQVPESSQHIFNTDSPSPSATIEMPQFYHQHSLGDTDGTSYTLNPLPDHRSPKGSEMPNLPSYDTPKLEFDGHRPNNQVLGHEPTCHQPQRLPSMEDDPYFSYPNLFTSQDSNVGSGNHSSTDNSRSAHEF